MSRPTEVDAPAWEVDINDLHSICFAPTKGAAQWIAVSSWREAGLGDRREWPRRLEAHRRPDLDLFPFKERRAFAESFVRDCL